MAQTFYFQTAIFSLTAAAFLTEPVNYLLALAGGRRSALTFPILSSWFYCLGLGVAIQRQR